MIDREKVIKGLECLITNEVPCDGCPYNEGENSSCLRNIANDALELLKEQEPVKPELYLVGQPEYKFYHCPVCKVAWYYKGNYCLNCGRPVKWDD